MFSQSKVLINALRELGASDPGRLRGYPGVWVDASSANPRKLRLLVSALLVSERCTASLSMSPPTWPTCVNTSLRAASLIAPLPRSPRRSSRCHVRRRGSGFACRRNAVGSGGVDRQDIQWRTSVTDLSLFSRGAGPGKPVRLHSRARSAGLDDGLPLEKRKPEWLRPVVHHGPEVLATRKVPRSQHGHRMRRRRLPKSFRMLGCRNGDIHGARRSLHTGLRILSC